MRSNTPLLCRLAILIEKLEQPGKDILVAIFPHKNILMTVIRKDMELMPVRDYFLKSLVTDNIGISKNPILFARDKEYWRLDVLSIFEVIIW